MLQQKMYVLQPPLAETTLATPLLSSATSSNISRSSTSSCSEGGESPEACFGQFLHVRYRYPCMPVHGTSSYKLLTVLEGHCGPVSCVAICGEFIISASQGKDIIVWQQPDMRQFAKFGHGDGSVKSLLAVGNMVFTAHQDRKIRAWKVSRSSENVFRLFGTLPRAKDVLGKCMNQSNYVQTRRNHKHLWIEHFDTISCLAFANGLIYSGSWDRTIKVWRISDLKCLESISAAHGDAINGLVAYKGIVYSASADGTIKAWTTNGRNNNKHSSKLTLVGHKDVSFNSIVVTEDGKWIYGGGSDGIVMGWAADAEFDKWKLVCEKQAHKMAILCMCLRKEYLCTGSADKSIVIWKREVPGGDLSRITLINGHNGPIKSLQASPNDVGGGFLLYTGSFDKSLRVWWVPKNSSTEEDSVNAKKTIL